MTPQTPLDRFNKMYAEGRIIRHGWHKKAAWTAGAIKIEIEGTAE